MSVLKNIGKVFLEIAYIVLGVILTNFLTIIKWLSNYTVIESPSEQIYPIDLGLNILIVRGIIVGSYHLYLHFQKSSITILFSDATGRYAETENYSFKEDVTTIYLNLRIYGRLKKLEKDKIILNLPPGVTASKGNSEDIKYEITGKDNTIEIPLDKIQSSKVYLKEEFFIDFKLIKYRENINSLIEVMIEPKFKLTREVIKNTAFLR